MFLYHALHDGSAELMVGVMTLLAGVVISLTPRGSGIGRHPYVNPHDGGELATDLPPESIGRPEIEPLLWPRAVKPRRADRSGRHRA